MLVAALACCACGDGALALGVCRGGSSARPGLTQVDDEDVWRVDVPVTEPLRGARAGHTHFFSGGIGSAREVDPAVPYRSFRPGWADPVPVPRLISRPPSLLQRFNRRRGGAAVGL